MKNSQKEREALLKSARMSYATKEIPAIHPRYGALYKDLYGEESTPKSSLGMRILISLVLFAAFAALEQGQLAEIPVSPSQITYQIETSLDL